MNIRIHDLQAHLYYEARGGAGERANPHVSIAGHLSRKMLEHYSHIRMAAKRTALEPLRS